MSSCPDCRQSEARVAGAPSGRFLVVWEGESTEDPRGVLRRLFEPGGSPRGADALINRAVAPEQRDSSVAADGRGAYVAVWTEERPHGGSAVLAQRLRPLGTRLGPALAVDVDSPEAGIQNFNPSVVRTRDGFVVVWVRFDPAEPSGAEGGPKVLARGFTAAGAPLGAPARLSVTLASGDRPDLCADGAGRLVAAWTTVDAFRPFQSSLEGVSARRLAASGAPIGRELIVARPEATRAPAAVSCGPAGFVVAWTSDQAPAVAPGDILAQRFAPRGRPLGAALLVNTKTAGDQRNPAISHDAAGRFVVVWQDLSARAIEGRRFGADGAPVGAQFAVRRDPASADPAQPDVAHVGTGGGFTVVWREGRSGVFGRLFGAPGTAPLCRRRGVPARRRGRGRRRGRRSRDGRRSSNCGFPGLVIPYM